MEKIEANVAHSFMKVKADIVRLQDEFMQLRENQIRLSNKLAKLDSKKPAKTIKVVKAKKPVLKRKSVRKTYVASKLGKKFHMSNCPFAQNIKPKTKVKFKTKTKALNLGYKPCSCIK